MNRNIITNSFVNATHQKRKSTLLKIVCIQLCLLGLFSMEVVAQDIFDIARTGTAMQVEEVYKNTPEQIDATNEAGYTPLILASYHGNYDVVQTLLKYTTTIDANSGSGTALMAATVKGSSELVSLLLKHDADPNITDNNGSTALLYAAFFKKNDIAALLLAHDGDISYKDNKGYNALDYATLTKNESLINLIKKYK